MRASVASSCVLSSDFGDGIPRTGRQLQPERLFDQPHEDRTLGAGTVGAEDVAAVNRENASAVDLDIIPAFRDAQRRWI